MAGRHVDSERPPETRDDSPTAEALREIVKLVRIWEQEFTGIGELHDVVQDHCTSIRFIIDDELGEDWY